MKNVYLDYAAATPLDKRVLAAMESYLVEQFYNPSAQYLAAKSVAKDIQAARVKIAGHLGARPVEIVFTAGGTEANNLAIHGVMRQFPDGNMIVSAIEHEAVLEPAKQYECKIAPVKPDGVIDIDKLTKLIDDKTVLVSIMYANNEIGTIEPIRQVSQKLKSIKDKRRKTGNNRPLYFHTDACQAANYLDLHTARLGVDMMTLNAGKIYGPKQCGALFVSAHTQIKPLVLGGGQERGLRSGTENVAAIIGFAKALDLAQASRHTEAERLQNLQQLFFDLLRQEIPIAIINGSQKHRLPNNIHVTFPGQDNERLMMNLDEHGIQCATGSACSASNEEPSHVLMAIGLSDKEAQASLRFTMGRFTDEDAVRYTVKTLAQISS